MYVSFMFIVRYSYSNYLTVIISINSRYVLTVFDFQNSIIVIIGNRNLKSDRK